MASPGTFISGLGHVGLIGLLIAGVGFDADPFEIETMDVSVISGEAFEQMRAAAAPDPGAADPQTPVPPQIDETPPLVPAPEVAPAPAPPPDPVTPPASETPPEPPTPQLQTQAEDQAPPAPAVPQTPPPAPELEVAPEPNAPQAPTVASTITAPPAPEANIDDIVRDAVVADDTATAQAVVEEQEATAPEETTTQIVPDDLAATTSPRPSARPRSLAPPSEPATETAAAETAPTETAPAAQDDVAAALEAALAATPAPAVAQGPPMTGAETDSFRVAVNRCWNVDPGSVASRVTVEVGFSLERDGTVRGNEVRLISSNGDQSATNTAFEAARRAVLRCQSGGYQLPADKYEQWKEAVIVFDPSGMRMR